MKITLSRGMAALCLLCILPKLGATVMQVGGINGSASVVGRQSLNVGGNWVFDLHDPSNGLLHSVSLQIETAVTVSIQETNFTGAPMLFAPNIDFSTYFGLFNITAQSVLHISNTETNQHLAAPFALAANESRTVSHTLVYRTTYTVDPAALENFVGPGNGRLFISAIVLPSTDRGLTSALGTTTALLTFNVTDAGATAAMLAIGLGLLLVVRRHGTVNVSTLS